ncbi:MAG TPA: PAS domain-containing protein, partial [Rhodothermales bacterium]|nr:PAS domain-containing protein [Rhodothermales bacterium]
MSRRSPPSPPDVPTEAPSPPTATGDGGLRSALRAAPLVVHRVGRDLCYEWVFNAHPDAPGAEVGTPVGAHLSPEERAPYVALLEGVLKTGRPARAQLPFTLPHGVAVFDLSMSPVFDAGGAVVGVTTAGYDVTPLREAQAALAASEERLRLAMAAGRMGTWEADPTTGEASWSEGMWALVGVAPRDAAPDEALWRSLIHPADAEAAAARYAHALATGDSFTDEYRVVRPSDGTVRWLASRGRVFRDAAGRPVRVLGVDYDVTEQRAAEAARRESEARFRHLADAMPQLAFVAEAPPGEPPVPVYYNARWYGYTGMSRPADPAVPPPTNWGDYLHPDDLAPAVAEQRRSAATGTPFELEYRFRRQDGTYRWFLGRAAPVEGEDGAEGNGAVVQWFGTCTDIHDRKRAEAALRESEERLRVALKHAPVIVQRLDRELRYEWMYNAYGDTPPDLIGKHAGTTMAPKEAAPYVRLMQRVLDTGEGARRELTAHLAGRRIVVDLTVEPVRDEEGAVVGVLTAAYDVTRIRQAESALEAAHVKLEAANAGLAEANAELERRVSARTAELEASTARLRES